MAVWEIVQYLLNALLFVLVGLQLPVVMDALEGISAGALIGYAALVGLTVVPVRFAWVFVDLRRAEADRGRVANARGGIFLSWAGMRGAVSLAAALALPLPTDSGSRSPDATSSSS